MNKLKTIIKKWLQIESSDVLMRWVSMDELSNRSQRDWNKDTKSELESVRQHQSALEDYLGIYPTLEWNDEDFDCDDAADIVYLPIKKGKSKKGK